MKKSTCFVVFLSTLIALLFMGFSCEKKGTCQEKTNANCVCTMQYDPVCGCNNKTYGNACEAECNGITEFKKGECK